MTQYIINLRANNTHNCEIFKSVAHTWLTVVLSLRNTGQRAKPLKHRIPKVTHVKRFFFPSFWQWAEISYHCADPKKTKKAVGTIKKTTEIQYHFFSSIMMGEHFESESGLTVFHSRSLNGIKKKAACILSWSMIFKWIKFFAIQEAWHCYKFILNACLARAISLGFEFLWSCRQWWEWFAGINVCLALNQCKWFLSLCLL